MFKYDKDKLKKSIEKTEKNPYWKKAYEEAPSDECKDYLEFTFYWSDYPDDADDGEWDEKQAEIEGKLSVGDWEYLSGIAPGSPLVGYCNQKIKEISK